jgi:periplasmic mercuric ion binding protein
MELLPMRFIVYPLVVLATAAIVYGVARRSSIPPAGVAETVATSPAAAETMLASTKLTLRVPEMHCPLACYPKVKETLESQPGVTEVALVPQANEGSIDRPEVVITTDGSFNLVSATAALDKAGFSGTSKID